MASPSRYLRAQQQLAAAAERACPQCGCPEGDHYEYPTDHPSYLPGRYHCRALPGCTCERTTR